MPGMELNLLRESVDLLILKALTWGPKSPEALVVWTRRATRTTVHIDEGTLYPALHRLTRRRMVRAAVEPADGESPARLYELTAAGHRQLVTRSSRWRRSVAAIDGALTLASSEAAW